MTVLSRQPSPWAFILKVHVISNYHNYFPPNFASDFLRGRERYFWGVYQWAFYTHIMSGPVSLILGLILIGERSRARFPKWHRYLGRLQVACVLLLVTPSGQVAWSAGGSCSPQPIRSLTIPTVPRCSRWTSFTACPYRASSAGLFVLRNWTFPKRIALSKSSTDPLSCTGSFGQRAAPRVGGCCTRSVVISRSRSWTLTRVRKSARGWTTFGPYSAFSAVFWRSPNPTWC